MQIKNFPYNNFEIVDPIQTLSRCLEQLYYNKMVTLDAVSISFIHQNRTYYIDENMAAKMILNPEVYDEQQELNQDSLDIHLSIYTKYPDIKGIVIGTPPIIFSLMEADAGLGNLTSMMEKRMVRSVEDHIYAKNSLTTPNRKHSLEIARGKTDSYHMGHLLMLIQESFLLSAAPNIFEAATHYQNVEFMAKTHYNSLFHDLSKS